jgi:hypothetical protein
VCLTLMQPCALYGSCVHQLGATRAIRKPCGIKWETDGAFKSHMHHMELPAPYGSHVPIWKVDDTMQEPHVSCGGNLGAI